MNRKLLLTAIMALGLVSMSGCAARAYVGGPPYPHAYWVPGHYVTGPYGGNHWIPGHWAR